MLRPHLNGPQFTDDTSTCISLKKWFCCILINKCSDCSAWHIMRKHKLHTNKKVILHMKWHGFMWQKAYKWSENKTCAFFPSKNRGPYPPCLRMADRALLAGYPRNMTLYWSQNLTCSTGSYRGNLGKNCVQIVFITNYDSTNKCLQEGCQACEIWAP